MALVALSAHQPIAKSQWQMTAFILMLIGLWVDQDNSVSCTGPHVCWDGSVPCLFTQSS